MIKKILSLVLLTMLLYSCAEKEKALQKEQLSFTISQRAVANENGRTLATDLPAGTSLLISLTDGSGNPVLTRHKINLLNFSNSYITDPLELIPGRYILMEFLLVNDSSEILYATPLRNSKLSKAVERSLPYSFVIGRNKISNIEIEVVDAKLNQPQDFGFAAFNVTIINPLQVSVFAKQDNALVLTSAKAYITKYESEIYHTDFTYNLSASVNLIGLKGGDHSTYVLKIIKEGYKTWTKSFTYQEIIAELNGKPLMVILEEPSVKYSNGSTQTFIDYNASGVLYVNYGSGEPEIRPLNYRPEKEGETDGNWIYLSGGGALVTITGSLSAITGFSQPYNPVSDITDLSALTSLNHVYFGDGSIGTLDLRYQSKLTTLELSNTSISTIIFPAEHQINSLHIIGETTYREQVIASVYNNAIHKNITSGYINITETTEPLTEDEQGKLDILKNDYNWVILLPILE